jgi:hypothetical protein
VRACLDRPRTFAEVALIAASVGTAACGFDWTVPDAEVGGGDSTSQTGGGEGGAPGTSVSSTASSATSGSSTSTSGAGGTGGDGGGETGWGSGACTGCIVGALFAGCAPEVDDCSYDAGCVQIADCVDICGYTEACFDSCSAGHSNGSIDLYVDIVFCATCQVCTDTCEGSPACD